MMTIGLVAKFIQLIAVLQFSFVLGVAIFAIIIWTPDKTRLYHVRAMIGSYILLTTLAGLRLMFESHTELGLPRLIVMMVAFALGDYGLISLLGSMRRERKLDD